MLLVVVLVIYVCENGVGMMFEFEVVYDEDISIMNDEEVLVDNEIVMLVIDGDKLDYDDDIYFDDEFLQLLCGG